MGISGEYTRRDHRHRLTTMKSLAKPRKGVNADGVSAANRRNMSERLQMISRTRWLQKESVCERQGTDRFGLPSTTKWMRTRARLVKSKPLGHPPSTVSFFSNSRIGI